MDFTLQKSAYPGQKTGSHLLKVTEAQGTQAGIRLRALAVKAAEAKSSRTILKQRHSKLATCQKPAQEIETTLC